MNKLVQFSGEHAGSISWLLNFQFDTLVRLMNTLVQFCGEHAGSISCLEHWIWTLDLL